MKNIKVKLGFSLIELSITIVVIAIIVLAVVKGSAIIKQSKLTSARALTNSSPVMSIGGLALWFDSSSRNAFDEAETTNDASISTWYDVNPNAVTPLDITQNTSSKKPKYNASGINGLPTVQFDGTSDYLSKSSVKGSSISGTDKITMFVVQQHYVPLDSTANSTVFMWQSLGCNNRVALINIPATNKIYFHHVNCSGLLTSSQSIYNNTPVIISTSRKHTNAEVRLNGASIGTTTMSSNLSLTGSATLYIGVETEAITRYFYGEIGEIIVFRKALTNQEISDIEDYLSKKWGINLN
jgi:prepilin-type N-terminal cleavage/methylation domain-containing protein